MSNVFFIIVSYNGMSWLPKTLASIPGKHKTLLIDNNSTDYSVKYTQENYPEAKILLQQNNLGFGQANNMGISYALGNGADYVFLLNQDAYLEDGSLEKLIEVSKKNPQYGVLSPIHLNGEGDKLDEQFSYYLSYKKNQFFYSDFVLNRPKKEVYEVPFVNAAGWLISKKCLNIVGGFDPIFFHYGEDDNYCQRLKYHNFKMGVVPNCFLRHDREFRKHISFQKGESDYLRRKEILYKREYADPNRPNFSDLNRIISTSKRAIFKSLLKLDIKELRYRYMEHSLLRKIKPEIKKSLVFTRKAGRTYLFD